MFELPQETVEMMKSMWRFCLVKDYQRPLSIRS